METGKLSNRYLYGMHLYKFQKLWIWRLRLQAKLLPRWITVYGELPCEASQKLLPFLNLLALSSRESQSSVFMWHFWRTWTALRTLSFPKRQIIGKGNGGFLLHKKEFWEEQNEMGVTGLHIGLQGKTNNKNTPKVKELGIQCEFYYWALSTRKPNTPSRKSVRGRKAAPDIEELAWHVQVGLAHLLFDLNGFTEHWPLVSPLWLWWIKTKIRILCNHVWTGTWTWALSKPQKWQGDSIAPISW